VDLGAGDRQPDLATLGAASPVRADQGVQAGGIAEPGPGHVDHDGRAGAAAAWSRGARKWPALVMSISSGVVTTGAPRVMRTGNPGSVIVIVVTSGQGWVRGGELVSVADQEGGYLADPGGDGPVPLLGGDVVRGLAR
jgi:hypothetical protein